jgi:[ribosomal protein S18]-alanine N-acetyltransferase
VIVTPRVEDALAIRPMLADDLDQVATLEQNIYEFPWSLGNFKDSLAAGYSCWTLNFDGVLCGYAVVMIGLDEAHLLNLSIEAPLRRRGLGRRMMAHLKDVAHGCEAIRFLLEVRRSNETARNFYAAHGFVEVGVRRNYYPSMDGREDAIIMDLML